MLTYSALLYLLCCKPNNRENLNDYLNYYIGHFCQCGRRHCCVGLETSEKHFNSLKDVEKIVLARSNTFNCLKDVCVTMAARS